MARRLYETVDDLMSEKKVADKLAVKWGVDMKKLPNHQRMDYAMQRRDKVVGLCEIKCRTFQWGDYPTVILSASKVKYAAEIYSQFHIKTMFAVCDREGVIKYTPIHELKYSLEYGGRTSTPRDDQDSELVVAISVYDFSKLEGEKNE